MPLAQPTAGSRGPMRLAGDSTEVPFLPHSAVRDAMSEFASGSAPLTVAMYAECMRNVAQEADLGAPSGCTVTEKPRS